MEVSNQFKSHLILCRIQQIFLASFIESKRDWYLITSSSDIPVKYHGIQNCFEYYFLGFFASLRVRRE